MNNIKDALIYFFGKGTEVEFEYFTLAHILPLIILFVVIFLMYKFKDKLAGYKHESTLRLIFGLIMIITDMRQRQCLVLSSFALRELRSSIKDRR